MQPRKTIPDSLALLISTWILTASAILVVLALYRTEDKPDLVSFLQHFDGKLLIAGVISLLGSTIMAIRFGLNLQRNNLQPRRLVLTWNILPLILIITLLEIFLRVCSTETPRGTILWGKPLAPHSLGGLAHDSDLEPLLLYDDSLGWIVQPHTSTSDEVYVSGEKGIRTSKSGHRFSAKNPTCRIALVGDSHTFGLELKFEQTWGYLLEQSLAECQVLNFGVSGYSLGQMYLRYKRDVVPFQPDFVILALSSGATKRTMGIYGNAGSGIPWAQPRFQITQTGLTPINQPLPRLEEIVQTRWMSDLPYIDYDWFFVPGRSELQTWRHLYNSYLFRLYITRYALGIRQEKGDSAEMLNHALLRAFIHTAETSHSMPLLLYLPDKHDEKNTASDPPSLHILRSSGLDFLDLRPCLNQVSADKRFIPTGKHYSVQGSEAIASCVMKHLSSLRKLAKQKNEPAGQLSAIR